MWPRPISRVDQIYKFLLTLCYTCKLTHQIDAIVLKSLKNKSTNTEQQARIIYFVHR